MELAHGAIEQVAEGIFVATPNPGEGTMAVVVTPQGKIAIDTTSYDRFARMVRQAIDARFDAPWRFVINTHSHFDHVGGNQIFSTPIIASTLTARRMQAFTPHWLQQNIAEWGKQGLVDQRLLDDPRIVMPDVLYERRLTLRLDNLSLEVTLLGGHSADSSVVYIPERRVLFAADLIFSDKPAATGEADLQQWQRSLQQCQELAPQVVVAGHGPPGGPQLIPQQAAEINALLARKENSSESKTD